MTDVDPHDILIRSSQDPTQDSIPAHSGRLAKGSHVFQSMLDIGSGTRSVDKTNLSTVEVDERYELLALLINILEIPPELPPPTVNKDTPTSAVPAHDDLTSKTLPWPLVVTLLDMADKYDMSEDMVAILHAHVQSHAPSYPMEVYALTSRLGLHHIASLASSFLLHPPMHAYPLSQIKALPSAASYHLILVLQYHRLVNLKAIIVAEPIFPHEYGACSKHGTAPAKAVWEARRQSVLDHIHAGSPVANMMQCDDQIREVLKACSDCCLGWERAVEMIRYKAGKVPREISQLPKDVL